VTVLSSTGTSVRAVRTLVTGGAGFIGSNLVDALVQRGDEVVVLDDLSTGRREQLPAGADLREGSVADPEPLTALMEAHRPEVVFHLAALIDVRRSVEDPQADARINVGGTIAVLAAAAKAGARRVVFSSTGGAIYGEAEEVPTPEGAPERPLSPYGQAKLAAEGYCGLFARLHGLSTVPLRYANVYGPRQDPLGEGGVVAIFCDRAREGRGGTIYGSGRQTRDFTYVGDVVEANLLAAESVEEEPVNIGTGTETSVLELAAALPGLETEHGPARLGEVERSCLDPARAAARLGWRPRTGLAEGLERTLASFEQTP
jgi:UDP-glucose 4-epimerase